MKRLFDWIKCTFWAHDIEIVPLELKDGIEPTPTLLAMAAMLGNARCKRCGKEWGA